MVKELYHDILSQTVLRCTKLPSIKGNLEIIVYRGRKTLCKDVVLINQTGTRMVKVVED